MAEPVRAARWTVPAVVAAVMVAAVPAPAAVADTTTIRVSSGAEPVNLTTLSSGQWCAVTASAEVGATRWTLTLTPSRPRAGVVTLEDRAEPGSGVCRADVPAGIWAVSVSVTGRPSAAVELDVTAPQPSITLLRGSPGARLGHVSAPIAGGRVLVTGGYPGGYLGGDPSPTQEVDPQSGDMWTTSSPLVHRIRPALAALPGGDAALIGGYTRVFDPVSLIEVYSDGRWIRGGLLARPRSLATATTLDDGRVLVAGGDWPASAEVYDPLTRTSRLTAPPPIIGDVAGKLADGRVLYTGNEQRATALFDPESESWELVGSTAKPRSRSSGTLLPDGRYLVTGGNQAASYWDDGEIFDPSTATWSTTSAMHGGRAQHTTTLLPSGLVLVLGGHDTGGNLRDDAQVYDPVTDRWASTRSADPRSGHTAILTDQGALLVIGGGYSGDRFAPRDLVYTP